MHLTDHEPAPADLEVTGESAGDACLLTVAWRATAGEPGFMAEPPYRPLAWSDLQALATAEEAQVGRDGAATITLRLPWVA